MCVGEQVVAEFSDGRIIKMEEDLSSTVDELFKRTDALEQQGKWEEAVDLMNDLEKKTRLVADSQSNARLMVAIVTACFKAKQMAALMNNVNLLCKKRSLIRTAMAEMVRACCKFLEEIQDKEAKLKLIDTLMAVTSGKIYVELERARLIVMLANIKEQSGDAAGAKETLLELQVESCGSMEKREKVTILLHQLRLCIELGDYTRAGMVTKKISPRVFTDDDEELQRLHVRYHQLLIMVEENNGDYLAMSRHYRMLSQIPEVNADEERCGVALKNFIVYALLAPYDSEQYDLLRRISTERMYEVVPDYRAVVRLFIRQELLNWKRELVEPYERVLRVGSAESPCTGIFDPATEAGNKRWQDLKIRAGEHSMRMIAKYYSRITIGRIAELLDWNPDETEQFLCRLIVKGSVTSTKIDRPSGIVHFKDQPTSTEIMDGWVAANNRLMDQLSKAAHLISKEEMLHRTFKENAK